MIISVCDCAVALWTIQNALPVIWKLLCTWIRACHRGSRAGILGPGARHSQLGERVGRWRWVQFLLPAHSWERPFLTAFSPEIPAFSRACYPIYLVRPCGSRWKTWLYLANSKAEEGEWRNVHKSISSRRRLIKEWGWFRFIVTLPHWPSFFTLFRGITDFHGLFL
jgi:hypothetical protein